jgi:two-component system, NtrC family, sensor kinase
VRHGLKVHITITLLALLIAATGLSFFVIASFWLRDGALSLAREKELQITLLAAVAGRQAAELPADQPPHGVTFFSLLAEESLRTSGAVAACLRVESELSCHGDEELHHAHLTRMLTDKPGATARSLHGLDWAGMVPGRRYLDLTLSLDSPDQIKGSLALRYPLAPLNQRIHGLQHYIIVYLGGNLIILLVIGFFRLHRGVIRPVENLIRRTDSYTDEGGVPFLALEGGNELGQLAGSMERMLGRIKADREQLQRHLVSLQQANQELIATREEMVRTEKLSSVGRLAAGLAHEIGNPLGIVQGYLGLIKQQDLSEQERLEFTTRAEQEVQRISRLVHRLLDLSRPAAGTSGDVDVHRVLGEVVDLLRPQPLLDGIELTCRLHAAESVIHGNAAQLLQVFLNCFINAADAVHAAGERGTIEVCTETVDQEGKKVVRIAIADNGIGLTEGERTNVFDPFFTTKEPGKGTGLGLSVSYALIKAMGGDISLTNRTEGGALATIILPLLPCWDKMPSASAAQGDHGEEAS